MFLHPTQQIHSEFPPKNTLMNSKNLGIACTTCFFWGVVNAFGAQPNFLMSTVKSQPQLTYLADLYTPNYWFPHQSWPSNG